MVTIKLPDGSVKEYPEGVRPRDVAEGIGKRLAEASVAAVANGTIVDMDRPLDDGQAAPIELRLLTNRDREALDVLRHSTAHVMARAIMRVFPGVKLAFGPTTSNGFYYDVDLPDRPLSEDDFPAIEAEMAKVIKDAEAFERFSLPVAEARQFVGDLGQGYKVEHIDEELHKYGVLSFYRQGEFVDLCRGPHIPHAGAKVGRVQALPRSRGPTGRARPTARCSSASTGPPSSTRRSWMPTSPRSRRPRSGTTGSSARNSACSPSRRWSARA